MKSIWRKRDLVDVRCEAMYIVSCKCEDSLVQLSNNEVSFRCVIIVNYNQHFRGCILLQLNYIDSLYSDLLHLALNMLSSMFASLMYLALILCVLVLRVKI